MGMAKVSTAALNVRLPARHGGATERLGAAVSPGLLKLGLTRKDGRNYDYTT